MDKAKKKRILVILIVLLLAAIIGVVVVILLKNKEETYRIIKVYEVEGKAFVRREGIGELEPYNNMVLQSGDDVSLDTGKMTLRLDDDKYVYVEENTEFVIKASGTKRDSKTSIDLKRGAITNEIQNKLSDESSYEVNTPNSTMAVRGTIYRVEVYYDENNVCYTKITVFQGKVSSRLVYPDGSIAENEVVVEQGKEVIIYEDDEVTDYLEIRDIDYSELPDDVIELLVTMVKDGKDLGISLDELEGFLKKKEEPSTVTFMYNGNVFGKQIVQYGECAECPSLMPEASGKWDFDFSTPITEDTEIEWR